MLPNYKKLIQFTGLTFFLSWSLAFIFFGLGGTVQSSSFGIVAPFFMLAPMLAALITQKLIYKKPIIKPYGISFKLNRWFFVAWLLPFLITFLTIGLCLLLPNVEFTTNPLNSNLVNLISIEELQTLKEEITELPIHLFWINLIFGLVTGITVNAVFGFGEELGWRGLMHTELASVGFWKSSLIIGLIWGIWHAPLVYHGLNYPDSPLIGILMMIVFCVLLSPIFTYVRIKSGSVVAAAILHGSLNASGVLLAMVLIGGNDLTVGLTSATGFVILFLVNCLIYFQIRKKNVEHLNYT